MFKYCKTPQVKIWPKQRIIYRMVVKDSVLIYFWSFSQFMVLKKRQKSALCGCQAEARWQKVNDVVDAAQQTSLLKGEEMVGSPENKTMPCQEERPMPHNKLWCCCQMLSAMFVLYVFTNVDKGPFIHTQMFSICSACVCFWSLKMNSDLF